MPAGAPVCGGTSPRSVKHPKGDPYRGVALGPAVDAHERVIGPRSIRARLWAVGLLALLVAIVAWFVPAPPYQAPWAWISFIGICDGGDFLLGSREEASWGELPKVALLAAVIVFRRHPEITVLVAV